MPQQTPSQARVIDPVLTEVARGYRNAQAIFDALFPIVSVGQRGGKIISFGREDFRLYNTGRAPGANTRRVNYGYQGDPYSLEQHALEGQVPFELQEEANAAPGIDLARVAINKTQNIIDLVTEKAAADLATNPTNYGANNKVTLSGTSQWSDYGNSDPSSDIEAGKEAVRSSIGRYPNTVVLGASVMAKLRQHPKLIDRIKYTGRDVVGPELLANLWGVKRVVIGEAVFEDASGNLVDVWGKQVILAYTEISGLADQGLPSFGYTYRLRGYPIVEKPYQDRNAKSWIYPVTDERQPVIAGADAGFLINNAVA